MSKRQSKVKPCICGKESAQKFYKASEMSPDRGDVILGTVAIVGIQIILPIVFFFAGISILVPFIVLPLPIIVLGLALYRLAKGHGFSCAVRWAYLAVAGTARFMSF